MSYGSAEYHQSRVGSERMVFGVCCHACQRDEFSCGECLEMSGVWARAQVAEYRPDLLQRLRSGTPKESRAR